MNKNEEEEPYVPFITPAERKRQNLKRKQKENEDDESKKEETNSTKEDINQQIPSTTTPTPSEKPESLLFIAKKLREETRQDPEAAMKRKREEEEARVLESALAASTQALVSASEHASDVKFRERIQRKWKPLIDKPKLEIDPKLILIDGVNVPFPIDTFEDMNLHPQILKWLKEKAKIEIPTPIQMAGLPVVLSGRDMIGVASTGSGKTLTFLLPAIMVNLEMVNRPLKPNEGPYALILGPSRDLQRQTFQIATEICEYLTPHLSCTLAIGGESKQVQLRNHTKKCGTNILIGTPGRVYDFLSSKQISLEKCTLLILDEGDRMMDEGFDEEVKKIIGHFQKRPRQTILFSATMPKRVVDFARDALVEAVVVNVGRAGAASSNITQYIERVKKDKRFLLLLDVIQRSPPPVLIFCTKNSDVDDVHEYLLLKGVNVRGIHAGKSQQERNEAVDEFKRGEADILVASDIAAKGLDFPQIAHVINFDLPTEIESYVHRIGRTGRGGKTGMATTLVDVTNENFSLLADLAGILRDAKQTVPDFLYKGMGTASSSQESLKSEDSSTANPTCTVCGGFGHRVTACPKLSLIGRKSLTRDVVTGGDY